MTAAASQQSDVGDHGMLEVRRSTRWLTPEADACHCVKMARGLCSPFSARPFTASHCLQQFMSRPRCAPHRQRSRHCVTSSPWPGASPGAIWASSRWPSSAWSATASAAQATLHRRRHPRDCGVRTHQRHRLGVWNTNAGRWRLCAHCTPRIILIHICWVAGLLGTAAAQGTGCARTRYRFMDFLPAARPHSTEAAQATDKGVP